MALAGWFDISYAGVPGGRAEEYESTMESRNVDDLSDLLQRAVDERSMIRGMLPWIADQLRDRDQLLNAAEGFHRLMEFIGEVTADEVNSLEIAYHDWETLLDNSERLWRALETYVRVLEHLMDRLNNALMVIDHRYGELSRALDERYAPGGGYVD